MNDRREDWITFHQLVNMAPSTLERWLSTDESKQAGQHVSGNESTGHAAGRAIVRILHKNERDLTEADHQHIRKVNGFIRRHLAQRPQGDVRETRWRHSLMNWGHDPLGGNQ